MNTKKLIGMIIGVTLFAALIAGATFAWMTFSANITNGAQNIQSRNFTFSYTNGSAIEKLLPLPAAPARNAITDKNGYLTLTVTKEASSAKSNSFKIYLHRNTWDVTLTGGIKYAVCKSATAANCNNSVATAIPTSTGSEWVKYGTITNGTDSAGDGFLLYEDTSTFNTDSKVIGNYYIYFWIDSSIIDATNVSSINGKTINGYVYAVATQSE